MSRVFRAAVPMGRRAVRVTSVMLFCCMAAAVVLACGGKRGASSSERPAANADRKSGAERASSSAAGGAVAAKAAPSVAAATPVDSAGVLAAAAGDAERAAPAAACHTGFAPSESPRVDVVRLGAACGPVSGLTELAKTTGVVDETGRGPVLRWTAERGDCFRLFAVAAAPVEDVRVEIKTPHGEARIVESPSRRWAVVGEDAPFCAPREGQFEASFTAPAGRGEVVASVWRGARMLRRR